MRVLVADEDEMMLEFISDILHSEDHHVSTANGYEEAIDLVDKEDFDMIITDILIPDDQGSDFIQYIQTKDLKTRILAVTGGVENAKQDYLNYVDMFCDQSLAKPFGKRDLLDAIHEVMAQKKD